MSLTIWDLPVSEMTDDIIMKYISIKRMFDYKLRDDTAKIWIGILRIMDECGTPMSVRQVFYQAEVRELVEKTENGYKQVARQLVEMRKCDVIPYSFIADSTRWVRKPTTYNSLTSFLDTSQEAYRKDLWQNQESVVEIWVEKEALAGVMYEETEKYDVPLFTSRGYSSLSFLHSAAEHIKAEERQTYIYYFGDYDPSGRDIPRHIQDTFDDWDIDYEFEIVAVNDWQISTWNLPTRPTKKTDTRAKNWYGASVELDAIPPRQLRELVAGCITKHINTAELDRLKRIEAMERETLTKTFDALRQDKQFDTSVKISEVPV